MVSEFEIEVEFRQGKKVIFHPPIVQEVVANFLGYYPHDIMLEDFHVTLGEVLKTANIPFSARDPKMPLIRFNDICGLVPSEYRKAALDALKKVLVERAFAIYSVMTERPKFKFRIEPEERRIKIRTPLYLTDGRNIYTLKVEKVEEGGFERIREAIERDANAIIESLERVLRRKFEQEKDMLMKEIEILKMQSRPMPKVTLQDFIDLKMFPLWTNDGYVFCFIRDIIMERVVYQRRVWRLNCPIKIKRLICVKTLPNYKITSLFIHTVDGVPSCGPHWNPKVCLGDAGERLLRKVKNPHEVAEVVDELLKLLGTINADNMFTEPWDEDIDYYNELVSSTVGEWLEENATLEYEEFDTGNEFYDDEEEEEEDYEDEDYE